MRKSRRRPQLARRPSNERWRKWLLPLARRRRVMRKRPLPKRRPLSSNIDAEEEAFVI
jgi:hypothetical protein